MGGGQNRMMSFFLLLSLSSFFSLSFTFGREEKTLGLVEKYKAVTDKIIDYAMKNYNFSKLEYVCDTFGPRYCGTPNLENAIDWIISEMKNEGLTNVRGETVQNITNWVRGEESLLLLSPRYHKLGVLGLGGSVGTPETGIIAEVLVVSTFEELRAKASQAVGKIVVFNAPFVTYEQTVAYRVSGASEAAKVGAVAALVRSVTPYSLYTLHTGAMVYQDDDKIARIPTASITVEDSEMFARMQARGQKIVLKLNMGARTLPTPVTSRNILAEVVGSSKPNEFAIMGGHVDSWDVGQGAMDDGGGFFSAWEALRILNELIQSGEIPRPKRTIRTVFWVNEEMGARGAITYYQQHLSELKNHVLAIESDAGNFRPVGYGFSSQNKTSLEVIKNISRLLVDIGVDEILEGEGEATDNGPLVSAGVPGMSLMSEGFNFTDGSTRKNKVFVQNQEEFEEDQSKTYLTKDEGGFAQRRYQSRPRKGNSDSKMRKEKFSPFNTQQYYFNYHHSAADTITSLNPDGIGLSAASMAVYTYVVADLDFKLN